MFNHNYAADPVWRCMHMALIPKGGAGGLPPGWTSLRGKILVFDEGSTPDGCLAGDDTPWAIIDPNQPNDPVSWQSFLLLHQNPRATGNLACSGHTWTADGRLFIAGGNEQHGSNPPFDPEHPCILGGRHAYLFDPTNSATVVGNGLWVEQPLLATRRWYPGVVLTTFWEQGVLKTRILVLGGPDRNVTATATYQAFEPPALPAQPQGSWQQYTPGVFQFPGPAGQQFLTYPYAHLMSNGQLVVAPFVGGTGAIPPPPPPLPLPQPALLRHDQQPGVWTFLTNDSARLRYRYFGCSLLFPNLDASHKNSLVVLGGAADLIAVPLPEGDVQMCRPQQPTGCWGADGHLWTDLPNQPLLCGTLQSMAVPRYGANAVILPDGSFLSIGGYNNSIERYHNSQWHACASLLQFPGHSQGGYGFHSTALLLPNGEVIIGGGDRGTLAFKRYDYQIYRPWYIAGGATRPQILSVNNGIEAISYGQTFPVSFQVQPGVAVEKVVLIRPGSVTHGANSEQRYIELDVATEFEPAPGEIWVKMPARAPGHPQITLSDVSGPPGFYMLFLVSSGLIPSEAGWVELKP